VNFIYFYIYGYPVILQLVYCSPQNRSTCHIHLTFLQQTCS